MALDSVTNGSVPPFTKEFGKKKRVNRLAKLKQCKIDARREQWLSQAKNKVCSPPSQPRAAAVASEVLESTKVVSKLEENDSDLESLSSSTLSLDSRKDRPGSSSGSSSSGCCSGNFSEEEEEEEEECLDDWEAVADALSANEKQNVEPPSPQEPVAPALWDKASVKPQVVPVNRCAWKPDDAFRPQSLPNLNKQCGFAVKQEQCPVVYASNAWARKSTVSPPSSCPICYEDLDVTDSSFLPCVCGFRLCLFCYKRIFEVGDGRCPGCRRSYGPVDGNAVVNGETQPIVNAAVQAMPRLSVSRSRSMSIRTRGKVGH